MGKPFKTLELNFGYTCGGKLRVLLACSLMFSFTLATTKSTAAPPAQSIHYCSHIPRDHEYGKCPGILPDTLHFF